MKVIATKQNADGSYDEVGMNNRALISHLTLERNVLKWAREYSRNRPHRIEFFTDAGFYGNPFKVLYR